ncbi:putative oxidoreductase [Escovopsis weberi]|uniref:Putative oxidoreductase n=1 Tax=Escovopsis weberi TaxID=150374 RepID=A0A0M8N1I4_ESCWE|nr:putative oxidoreductase [Escovopsis weberi]
MAPDKLTLKSTVKLNSGYDLPLLGFGIDTATRYYNQAESGAGLVASGVPRDQVFFTTKISGANARDGHLTYATLAAQVDAALAQTGLAYLDLVLIHCPYGGPRTRRAAWTALVDAVDAGKVRSIGVSNYGVAHLDELEALIRELEAERGPGRGGVLSVGQYEMHPWIRHDDIEDWCARRGVVVQAYCPIVRGQRFGDAKLVALAERHGKSQAQVLLRWGLQRGYPVVIRTGRRERLMENMDVFDFELEEHEVLDLVSGEYSPCTWDPTVEPLEV